MAKFVRDLHFLHFAKSLQEVILGYSCENDSDFTARQKAQVEKLIRLENKFKKILQNDSRGIRAYHEFIKYIVGDKKNILAARPFFRERQRYLFQRNFSCYKKQ